MSSSPAALVLVSDIDTLRRGVQLQPTVLVTLVVSTVRSATVMLLICVSTGWTDAV